MTKEADTEMQYPKREQFFAHKFCRLLTKSAAAMEIGAQVCWMLSVIAMQEDAKRYRGPVSYWNEQLMVLIGVNSKDSLIRLRKKAIEHGWLQYEAGGKGKAGKYWVTIPEMYLDVEDGPMDESTNDLLSEKHDRNRTENTTANDTDPVYGPKNTTETGRQVRQKPDDKCDTFIPSPNPIPNPKERTSASDFDDITMEAEFIREWNATPGVTKYGMNALPSNLSGIFRQRWEAHEDWMGDVRKALGMFPPIYYAGGSVQMKTFLQQFDTFADPNAWPHKPKGESNEQPKRTVTQQREQNNADVLNWALSQCGGEEDGSENC